MRRALLTALAALCLATLYFWASGALFMRLQGLPASLSRPWSAFAYLAQLREGGRPAARALLLLCLALPWAATGAAAFLLWRASRERPLHGAARFAGRREIREADLEGPPGDRILAGRVGGTLLGLPGPRFALVAAPTRSGKGVGIVIPNCLSWEGSLVVLDIKLENFEITSGWRRKALGQKVFLFAPFDPGGRTHQWNPLEAVSGNEADRVGDVDALAASLYESGSDRDRFWTESAKDLFRGLCLLVLETPGIPHTIGQVLRESSGYGKSLKDHVRDRFDAAKARGGKYSAACRDSLSRVLNNSENTLTSIVASFNVPLLVFQNPRVDAATSDTSPGLELGRLREKPITVYLGITPDRLAEARVIVNLFFDQLLALNTRSLPSQNPKLRYRCLVILDEFTSIGKVPMIEKAVSYLSGYGLRLLTIVQNRSQLEQAYGKAGATTILANHALLVIFAPSPAVTSDAREASEMLGYQTVAGHSRSRPSFWGRGSGSVSESEQRRALMLPQELRELGGDREIIALENTRPVLARKIRYYEDPFFRARLLPAARDEVPLTEPAMQDGGGDGSGDAPGASGASLGSLEAAAPRESQAPRQREFPEPNWIRPRAGANPTAEGVSRLLG